MDFSGKEDRPPLLGLLWLFLAMIGVFGVSQSPNLKTLAQTEASRYWVTAPRTGLEVTIVGDDDRPELMVSYSYQVGDRQLEGNQVFPGETELTLSRKNAERLKLWLGEEAVVHHDPVHPEHSCLLASPNDPGAAVLFGEICLEWWILTMSLGFSLSVLWQHYRFSKLKELEPLHSSESLDQRWWSYGFRDGDSKLFYQEKKNGLSQFLLSVCLSFFLCGVILQGEKIPPVTTLVIVMVVVPLALFLIGLRKKKACFDASTNIESIQPIKKGLLFQSSGTSTKLVFGAMPNRAKEALANRIAHLVGLI